MAMILIAVFAGALGGLAGYVFHGRSKAALVSELAAARAHLAERDEQLSAANANLEAARKVAESHFERAIAAEQKLERATAELAALRRQFEEQKAWFAEQTAHFRTEVENATNKILEEKTQKFTTLNTKSVGDLLNPLREQLGDFRKKVETIYDQDSKERVALTRQIDVLQGLHKALSQQTENLTNALTTSGKAQGDWGEFVLRRLLEDSGLREGHEYELQVNVTSGLDDDARQRPDAIIFMPENRQLVVDSKVSLKAWTAFTNATEPATREAALEQHLASMRKHVADLAKRDYARSPDLKSVDFTVMFVPIEAAFLEAMRVEPSLFEDAYRRGIIIVVPTTLFAVIKMVQGMWSVQRQEEHAAKIAELGRKLYEKLCGFVDSFEEVGGALDRARGVFEQARGQLRTGKGNAIRIAAQMLDLDVPTQKRLPADYVQAATNGMALETDSLATSINAH